MKDMNFIILSHIDKLVGSKSRVYLHVMLSAFSKVFSYIASLARLSTQEGKTFVLTSNGVCFALQDKKREKYLHRLLN